MHKTRTANRKRNRGFEETHQVLIETAVRLLSDKGVEALSVSALAREAGLNRTTVYYHFPNREAMLRAVKDWSTQQLARGMCLVCSSLLFVLGIRDVGLAEAADAIPDARERLSYIARMTEQAAGRTRPRATTT